MRHPTFNTKWLYPGMHIKRWLLLLLFGLTLIALGVAFALRDLYVHGFRWSHSVYYLALQFLPRGVKAVLFGGAGLLAIGFAIWQLKNSLVAALLSPRQIHHNLADIVYERRLQSRGPRIVALGGGHGLSTLLSGLKNHTERLIAIVNVADDGGSSGRLTREFGVLPPGDIRRCIAAMAASDEALMAELFEYRFSAGEGLEGHTFGNLFITALYDITGSFDLAIQAASQVLAIRGGVLPPTLEPVTLAADLEVPVGSAARVVEGESHIAKAGFPIHRVFLRPAHPRAYPTAVQALLAADLIVIGPGSLYTSLLPVLLVEEIRQAIIASGALVVYVCNVATEPGETDHFGVQAHLKALIDHIGGHVIDIALANNNEHPVADFAPEWRGRTNIVPLDVNGSNGTSATINGIPIVAADLINATNPLRHDPSKLAGELIRLLRSHQSAQHS